jgi:hypothetical protein
MRRCFQQRRMSFGLARNCTAMDEFISGCDDELSLRSYMTFARSQKGLSLTGLLLALALGAFVLNVAFKLVPHYVDNRAVKKIINAVDSNQALEIGTVNEFYSYVGKSMQVNSIQDLDLNKALSVTVENNRFLAHLKYEKREPLIQNIDLVVMFDDTFSVGKP